MAVLPRLHLVSDTTDDQQELLKAKHPTCYAATLAVDVLHRSSSRQLPDGQQVGSNPAERRSQVDIVVLEKRGLR
jgi:hypothetical protein